MEFDEVVTRIPFDLGHALPVIGLRSPDARYPASCAVQGTLKGFNLADAAAFFPVLNRFVKTSRPLFTNQLLYRIRVWKITFNLFTVDFQRTVPNVVCFAEQPTRFERENMYG